MHLGRCGFNRTGTQSHHGRQNVPTVIFHQLQQAFIHSSQGDFRACRGRLAVCGCHPDGNRRLFAHLVCLSIRIHHHVQFMGLPADIYFRHADPEGGFSQIGHGGRLNIGYPPAHRQHRHIDVRRIISEYRHFNDRRFAGYFLNTGFHNPFALDGDQGRGFSKRHPHLKTGGLSRLEALFDRDQIHPVVIPALEPPLFFSGNPDTLIGQGPVSGCIPAFGNQKNFSGYRRFALTEQQPLCIGLSLEKRSDPFDFGAVVVAVKPAHQTLPVRHDISLIQRHLNRRLGNRFSRYIHHRRPKLEIFQGHGPIAKLNPDKTPGIPERYPPGNGLSLTVRVVEFHFKCHFPGPIRVWNLRDPGACKTVGIQSQIPALEC